LQFMGNKLTDVQSPFMASVFTLSSHHPYKVPEQYEGVFDKGTLPIHQCIGYTDNALRKFFNYAKLQDWYDNTLFVFTADHSVSSYFDVSKTSIGYYSIPIFFYSPNENDRLKGRVSYEIQQTDISPTLLNYLNYPGKFLAFGNDAFDKDADHFVVNYTNNIFQFIQNGYVLHFDGKNSIALYNYIEDRLLKNNILTDNSELVYRMEQTLKAYIQQYNNRVLDNKMIPE
jgi:phosphoglycerol transferase MdoB-like AlkP superfamily enzyme